MTADLYPSTSTALVDDVEYGTAEWVDWFNHRRLYEYCGDIPPAELEAAYYAHNSLTPVGGGLTPVSLRTRRGHSHGPWPFAGLRAQPAGFGPVASGPTISRVFAGLTANAATTVAALGRSARRGPRVWARRWPLPGAGAPRDRQVLVRICL